MSGKRKKSTAVELGDGDVLIMKEGAQERYEHSIKKGGIGKLEKNAKKVKMKERSLIDDECESPRKFQRVSLTFRYQE